MTDDNDARMRFARDIAVRAGELGLSYFRRLDTLTIESKGHQDLVSDGDRDVETFIRAAIAKEYPGDGIVGEEHANVAGASGYVWVIDPIDGTANFVRGIPAWTVVIAGVRDGVLDVGVIQEPSTGETFYGRRGGGAFLNGKSIRTSTATDFTTGSIGTGFSNRRDPHNVARLIDLILDEGGVFYRNASGALMLAYVAVGPAARLCRRAHERLGLPGRHAAGRRGRRPHPAARSADRPGTRHDGHRRRRRRVRQASGALRKVVQPLISTGPRSAKPSPIDCPAANGASTSGDTTKTSPNSVLTTNSRWLPT